MITRCLVAFGLCLAFGAVATADHARRILEEAGVEGGLIVHLGCGDAALTISLQAGDNYLVQGLDRDAAAVARAREKIRSLGKYGRVSIERLSGTKLPYADNLVNLLVVDEVGDVTSEECFRVLAPNGIMVNKVDGTWKKTVKPWPSDIDEWTHHLHDAGGNPVATDSVVGPPQHLQWTAGPLWARSHGWTPSVTAMVSSGGRLFYICDETLTGAGDAIPSKWFLVARDAFSGVLLWKRPMGRWGAAAFSGIPDTGAGISVGRFTMPSHAGKRLVADGDTLYVTMSANGPVSALDAATGSIKQHFPGTENADEVLYHEGRLIVSTNPPRRVRPPIAEKEDAPAPPPGKRVCAVDAPTGRVLWKAGPFAGIRAGRGQDPFGRLELVAGENKVFLLTTQTLKAISVETGDELWSIARPILPEGAVRRLGFSGMYEFQLTVMVYHDGVVLLAQPEPNTHHTYHTMPGTLYAFDANEGRQLWEHAYGGWGHCTPPDVFVIDDTVWSHVNAETEFGSVWGKGYKALDTSMVDYRIQALDLKTGAFRREVRTKDIFNVGHHHRCYRNKITERFLMSSRRGVEFVDLDSGENYQNHWVRSGCLLGYLPCNGLLYTAPHPCGCYVTAKLTGFNALAGGERRDEGERVEETRLEKGPAYGAVPPTSAAPHPTHSWPTYRHDMQRSGSTESPVGAALGLTWSVDVGSRMSSPVIGRNRVLVADVDAHTVCAVNADDGTRLWSYSAGGRVNSPPAIRGELAVFGCADGCVYCLRLADGALVWKFQAAPKRRTVTAFGQLESTWPVPGVLVQGDACWFAAGRSSYLDGGVFVYALDIATGGVLQKRVIHSLDPTTGKMKLEPSAQTMAGLLNDIPGSDGKNVFIRQMNVSSEDSGGDHLFSTGGFLDSSWFNRTFWKMGRAQTTGPMVLGDGVCFGVEPFVAKSRDVLFQPGRQAYRLRCLAFKAVSDDRAVRRGESKKKQGRSSGARVMWEQPVDVRVTSMVRAGQTLFVAGPPDMIATGDPHGAWEGRCGGVLAAYSCRDGARVSRLDLPAPPVWDGMAAAGGKLYISLMDGSVRCLAEADHHAEDSTSTE